MLPKPNIPPFTTSLINDFFLNSSLLYILDICNSIFGLLNIWSASLNAIEVWVNPAALIIIPSCLALASCIHVTISPSILDWTNSSFRSNSFDCITLWHSIEHLYDLNFALDKINEIIKNNGTIFIACPNFKAVERIYFNDTWAAIDAPRHLYHFTFNSMKELLKKHNIKIIRTHRMIQDTFFNIYKSRKYSFLYKFIFSISSFFIIICNKRKSSSLLFVCKPIK